MDNRCLPSQQDYDVLVLANEGKQNIVLTSVTFNGEPRLALAYLGQNPHGMYLRVLGVLPKRTDVVLDATGMPTSEGPPCAPSTQSN